MMPGADGYTVLTALRNEPATAGIPFIFLTAKDQHEDLRAGMNLGASDYLTKPVNLRELLAAVRARLALRRRSDAAFDLDTASPLPLESLGLTPREAESLFWATRGKNSPEIAAILGIAAPTVRKHFEHILDKLGVDNRYAAMLIALDCLRGRRSPAGAAST